MPHKRAPRRSKMDRQLITLEQTQTADVIEFEFNRDSALNADNLVSSMSPSDIHDVEDMIQQRFDSAKETTDLITKEIERAERQFSSSASGWSYQSVKTPVGIPTQRERSLSSATGA